MKLISYSLVFTTCLLTHCLLASEKDLTKPPANTEPNSVFSRSTILSDGGKHWTIVPKSSVIFAPDSLKNKINSPPVGKFLSWKDFYKKNSDWIHSFPVDSKLSKGVTTLKFDRYARLKQVGKVVVAVHPKGPISIKHEAIEKQKPHN
ncbi:hypothetical protein [Rubritalea tangerina]|uniref:Uncharacterized protein n=1 Tax=Rubritalea tangerina TaxID=430798 RepID=A0ABW4ZEM8_9BACT